MTDIFKQLAQRFCSWPLPSDLCVDACAANPAYAYPRYGTHLLSVAQAEQMLRDVLAGEASYRTYCEKEDREPDGTRESLAAVASMLEQYCLAELPANDAGQVDFMRALVESAVAEIRAYLANPPAS